MTKSLFVQPRHPYASDRGKGQVYTPTSLWTAGSKYIQAGADIEFIDENLHYNFEKTRQADVIGLNVVGAPYIAHIRERFWSAFESDQTCIIGGQVINGLSNEQFSRLFGTNNVIPRSHQFAVANAVGADFSNVKRDEDISLIPAYEKIPDADMREYLDPKQETSLYLGQGCIFDCMFCPAEKNRKETYRDMNIIETDLTYLTERALRFDIHQLNMYLSNLDVFQTPEKLGEFASIVNALKRRYEGFTYPMRGLATATCFRNAVRDNPDIVRAISDAGLHTVGFGVDGSDERVWRSVKKGHNNRHTILEAMEGCTDYGFTPEAIMVFGHPKDNRSSLENAVRLTEKLQKNFGAVPRPHVAKDLIPGNDYWQNTIKKSTKRERRPSTTHSIPFGKSALFPGDGL